MSLTRATQRVDVHDMLRKRVVGLFRTMCRKVPRMVHMYELGHDAHEIRHLISLMFRKNARIRDPRLVEMLCVKGEMEMDEVMNQWKQKGHIQSMFNLNADRSIDAPEETRNVLDNQWWMSGILEAIEGESGLAVDKSLARDILAQARKEELGDIPGEALAPAQGEAYDRYYKQQRTGQDDFLDRFLAGTEQDNPASHNNRPSSHTLPEELRQLRKRNADGQATREQLRFGLMYVAASEQQGYGPTVRPPKSVEHKNLPLWMATKVHWPWIDEHVDADDPRVRAAVEHAQDELEANYREQQANPNFDDEYFADQRRQMADKYRHGRVQ